METAYHFPAGVREMAIFLGKATGGKYFLISLKTHSTAMRTREERFLNKISSLVREFPLNGVNQYGRRTYPENFVKAFAF
jgi:hypothetical protein